MSCKKIVFKYSCITGDTIQIKETVGDVFHFWPFGYKCVIHENPNYDDYLGSSYKEMLAISEYHTGLQIVTGRDEDHLLERLHYMCKEKGELAFYFQIEFCKKVFKANH